MSFARHALTSLSLHRSNAESATSSWRNRISFNWSVKVTRNFHLLSSCLLTFSKELVMLAEVWQNRPRQGWLSNVEVPCLYFQSLLLDLFYFAVNLYFNLQRLKSYLGRLTTSYIRCYEIGESLRNSLPFVLIWYIIKNHKGTNTLLDIKITVSSTPNTRPLSNYASPVSGSGVFSAFWAAAAARLFARCFLKRYIINDIGPYIFGFSCVEGATISDSRVTTVPLSWTRVVPLTDLFFKSLSGILDKNRTIIVAIETHGIREMKAQRTPCRKASLTAEASSGERLSMSLRESIFPSEASFARSVRLNLPEDTISIIPERTLALRTALHWAKPTVPPKVRNCVEIN